MNRMRRLAMVLAGAAVSVTTPSAVAADKTGDTAVTSPLERFQRSEDRLFRIGYRLATANAAYCTSTVPATGMLIHDARSYARPESVRAELGLSGDIGVQSVAENSPAAAAGLTRNDTILAIGGNAVASEWPPTEPGWKRATAIRDALDAALVRGPVDVTFARAGEAVVRTATVAGVPACATRFELIDSKDSAKADGTRVLVGEKFPGFSYDEDALAAAIAHELAHNLLGHARTFERTGRKRRLVRISERDADRLMPWLLHNAGYDPAAAVRFMRRWGPRHGGGILRKRTHDGWDERIEFIEAELPLVTAAAKANDRGMADWSKEFTRLLGSGE